MAKKPTSATARSCGMLIDVSVWAMVAVFVELVAGRGGWVFARRRSPRVVCLRVAGGSDGVRSCLSGVVWRDFLRAR
jgi:hypothetical protein